MTQAERIIARFGGINSLARAIGRQPSTVQFWKERGAIPDRRYREVLAAGAALEPPLRREEFIDDLPSPRECA